MDDRLGRAAVYIRDAIEGRETVSRSAVGVAYGLRRFLFYFINNYFHRLWQFTTTKAYKYGILIFILFHMAIVFGEPASHKHYDSVPYTRVKVCLFFFFYWIEGHNAAL